MINIFNEDFIKLKNNTYNFETFINEYFNFNFYLSDMKDIEQKKITINEGRYNYTREYLARLTTHFNILIDNNLIVIEDITHIKDFIMDVSKELYQHRPKTKFINGIEIDFDREISIFCIG